MGKTRGADRQNKDMAESLLRDVVEILGKHNISYWLDYGTLLGVIRENDFIDSDIDMDVSYFANQDIRPVMDDLQKKYTVLFDWFSNETDIYLRKAVIDIEGKHGFTKLEIVPSYKHIANDTYYKVAGMKDGCLLGAGVPGHYLSTFKKVPFRGMMVSIPDNNVEGLLEYHYGDWKTPNAKGISKTYVDPFTRLLFEQLSL